MIRASGGLRPVLTMLTISLLLFGIAGCAGKSAKPLSAARLQAMAHNKRGIQLEAGGRRDLALAEFDAALRLQSSIENSEGMIVALINLARTQRLKGDQAAARQAAERAVALLPEASDLAPELFYEMAKILLAGGDLPAAKQWALRAEAAEKGRALGRRANLVAAILFRQGLPDQAREQAEKALKLNQADGLAGEEANSLRLLGEMHLAQGMSDRAADRYGEALALDKELSFGRKIAADLRGLGEAHLKKSDVPKAIGFYRRALEVSLNRGDNVLAAQDLVRLAEIYRQSGESAQAERMDAERKKLPAADK